MTVDFDIHRLAVGFPEASTDAMLTESVDLELSMARFHGPLYLLFENPRSQAFTVDFSVYRYGFSVFRHQLFSGGSNTQTTYLMLSRWAAL
jgi:hypothetical protein